MRSLFKLASALTLIACASHAALAAEADGTRRFYGFAYDLKSNKYLYTEVYEQVYENGRWKSGRIRDYSPDGKPISDKSLDFSSDPNVPVYRFELPQEKYVEAITAVSKTEVKLFKQADGKTSEKTVKNASGTAADSGFHCYLVSHFDELMQRKTVAFRFIVAGNLDSYSFRVNRIDDTRFDGKTAVRFRVEPDSFLRYLVDPLELTYDPDQKRLLEYRGISNVHDPATGKAYNVHVIYPAQPPANVPNPLPSLNIADNK